jgi:hypothetical protein
MRRLLILWLIEVHAQYNLKEETLFLTVNLLDRMASKVHIPRQQYQLVGLAALWIAAKYEENHGRVPTLKNLSYISCKTFQNRDILAMERMILNHLHFDLGSPSCESFLKAQCAHASKHAKSPTFALARCVF